MIQVGGLAILFAWLIFAGFLSVLAYFVLRTPADPITEAEHRPDETPGDTGDQKSTASRR